MTLPAMMRARIMAVIFVNILFNSVHSFDGF